MRTYYFLKPVVMARVGFTAAHTHMYIHTCSHTHIHTHTHPCTYAPLHGLKRHLPLVSQVTDPAGKQRQHRRIG